MQNKKWGQATFSEWTASFIRKNGACPHFTMKKVACPLYYLENRKWGLAPLLWSHYYLGKGKNRKSSLSPF